MVIGWFIDSSSTFPSTLSLLSVFSQVCWAQAADHHTSHTEEAREESHTLSQAAGEAQRGRQRNRLPVGSGEVLCGSHFSTAPERMMGKYYGCENNRFKKKGKICTHTTVYKKICEMYCILLAFTSSYHQFWCINAQAKFSSFVQCHGSKEINYAAYISINIFTKHNISPPKKQQFSVNILHETQLFTKHKKHFVDSLFFAKQNNISKPTKRF